MDHATLIERLGGGAILAERLRKAGIKVDREAIYKWREYNHIPWKWRSVIASAAEKDGITIPRNFLPEVPKRFVSADAAQ